MLAISVIAVASSDAPLIISETAGTTYAGSTGFDVLVNNTNLISQGFMTPTGLDAQVLNGSVSLPRMIVSDRTKFVMPALPANTSQTLTYSLGNTPTAGMSIVPGYNGYITTADTAALEPGNNYLVDVNGYVNTAAGATKNIVNKSGALVIDAGSTTAGNVTAKATLPTTSIVQVAQDTSNDFCVVYGANWVAQTFTPTSTFTLTAFNIYATANVGVLIAGNITAGLYATTAGVPSGAVIVSTNIASGAWAPSAVNTFAMAPTSLTSGVMYAVVLSYPNGDGTHYIGWLSYSVPGPYAGGTMCQSTNSGATWGMQPTYDNKFDVVGYIATVSLSSVVATGAHDVQVSQVPNVVVNSSCEVGNPPTSWILLAGSIAQSTTQVKYGSYSLAVTRAGADAGAYQFVTPVYAGKEVTVGCWVWCSVANTARMSAYDNVASHTFSAYHTGSSTWEFLTITKTINPAAAQIAIQCNVNTNDTTAYFDGAILTVSNNLVSNGSFEVGGPPVSWSYAAGTFAQSATHVVFGAVSLLETRAGVDTDAYQLIAGNGFGGSTITTGCWVWASVANTVCITAYNTTGGSSHSAFHPGDSTWHFLTVTQIMPVTDPLNIGMELLVLTNNTTAYFDGAILVRGTTIPGFWQNSWDFLPNQYYNFNLGVDTPISLVPGTYAAIDGGLGVIPNGSVWLWDQTNVMPYMNYITEQVNGIEVVNYAPTTIISGTVLPNQLPTIASSGAFTYGTNPVGVTTTLGNLVGPAVVGVTPSAGPVGADIVKNTTGGNPGNYDPATAGTTGPGSWIDPIVSSLVTQYNQPAAGKPYQGTQVSIQQVWMIIGLAVILCSAPVSVALNSMWFTLLVVLGVEAALCSQTVFPWSVFYVSTILMAALFILLLHRTSGGAV
jgi:hypothetical protein